LFSAIARVFRTPDLRRKIAFTLAIIAIYRLGAHVPAPFVSFRTSRTAQQTGSASEGLLSLVNLFSGGALLQLSIFALGVMPYITATIIVQLLRVVIPHFEALYKEGRPARPSSRSTPGTSRSRSRSCSRRPSSRSRARASSSARPAIASCNAC
jgi:preprotein translocase subunit SecY